MDIKEISNFLKYLFHNFADFVENFLYNLTNFDYIGFLSNVFSMMTFDSLIKLIIIYFFVVWIAIIIWVTKDIINRTNNILLQVFSIFTVLLGTPLGLVVYLLIRPSKTLFERYYEEASIEENIDLSDFDDEEKLLAVAKHFCPVCSYPIQLGYRYCPNCRNCIRKECSNCGKELNHKWTICPYCGKDQENKVENILANVEEDKTKKKLD